MLSLRREGINLKKGNFLPFSSDSRQVVPHGIMEIYKPLVTLLPLLVRCPLLTHKFSKRFSISRSSLFSVLQPFYLLNNTNNFRLYNK